MPWGPRSRTRSQTLSQLHSGSASISTMCLRWGTVDASARSLEWSSCNMTFFKAAVEIDMGSVRMSEVRLEPYCDSRKRHWRTSWMDSTTVHLTHICAMPRGTEVVQQLVHKNAV